MIGQGSPNASRGHFASLARWATCWRYRLVLIVALAFSARGAAAAEETIRLRIDWGGADEELWQGVIAVSEGTLSEPHPLGIEADEPGSMWLERGPVSPALTEEQSPPAATGPEMDHLVIRSRSRRAYDGVDLLVTAPLEAKLLVALWTPLRQAPAEWVTIPLAELLNGAHRADLDARGNRLLVRRAPGDELRVTLKHDSLVFSPGETLTFELEPYLLPVEPDAKVRIRIELTEARASHGRLIAEHRVVAGEPAPIRQPVSFSLPEQEGVYDVLITATHAAWLRWTQPVRGQQPFASRRIQLVVLNPRATHAEWPVTNDEKPLTPQLSSLAAHLSPLTPHSVEEIDPANPKWWERFAKLPHPRRLPRLWKGPLGNGYSRTWRHPLGQLVELGPCPNNGDVAWEAYTLPIEQPGRPHLLEVDYPSDVPQTMGISIIEPNAAGAVLPIGLDSGVDLSEEVTGTSGPSRWLKHRMIFWPKTKSPMVLITNRRDEVPAVYGKIRVLSFGEQLPPFPSQGALPGQAASPAEAPAAAKRLLAAYLDRPLFPENFSASQSLVASSGLAVDDWVTFYEGGTRLVEYLNHVGFGGLMVSVLADGSTIYPSTMFEPTGRYDTGALQEAGQDPIRKDVVEMLFRLFDRQELDLIPALEFAAPLPELEAALRRGGEESKGIRWVGPEGKTWLETYPPLRGTAPYYNVLHPRVQDAILASIREVARRYGHHASFAGLAIQLSGYGYAQLPGPNWGMDDATIARFERDMNLRVPGEGPERFAERARFLATQYPRQWLDWRAQQLSWFYRRIQAELAAVRPGARLYLAGANMWTGQELERALRPLLPREMTIAEAMLRVGIDVRHYGEDQGLVLLRPERIAPERPLARDAVNLEIQQMLDVPSSRPPFADLPVPGSLFFHQPQEVRLASFDEKSPFKPSYTWLAAEPVPAAHENRRRFVRSLAAIDSQVMFDGGWMLPLGQEDSLRNVVAAFRQLPPVRFQRLAEPSGSDPAQPVTIRYATYAGATYVYLVNDAPFHAVAQLDLACPSGCQLEELTGLRQAPPLQRDAAGTHWTVELEPYDLLAVRLSAPGVGLSRAQAWWDERVQTALKARITELGGRAAALRTPPILDVLENPGFEAEPTADGRIPGWATSSQSGASVALDALHKRVGAYSVKMTSRGPVASLVSQPFDAPCTGRLTMSVWFRGAGDRGQGIGDRAQGPIINHQPSTINSPWAPSPVPCPLSPVPCPLQLVLEGYRQGEYFSRYAAPQVRAEWGAFPFVVQVDDLPLDGLSRLRIRFDLMGPGEVWIDEVQLSHLVFTKDEKNALLKLIAPAEVKLDRAQIRDCIHLLEGYWPQFLRANVPMAEPSVADAVRGSPDPARVGEVTRPAPSTSQPPLRPQETPQEPPGVLDRMRAFVPQKLRFF